MFHYKQLLNDLPGDCAIHLEEEDIWTESDKIWPPSHLPSKCLDYIRIYFEWKAYFNKQLLFSVNGLLSQLVQF